MDNRFMIRVGVEVRTSDGKTLGKIKQLGSGTFDVEKGLFFKRDLSVSYEDVASADEGLVTLDLSNDDLRRSRDDGALGTSLRERAAGAVDHAVHAAVDAVAPSSRWGRERRPTQPSDGASKPH